MKLRLLTITLFVISTTMNAQNKLPDDGISGETHHKYLGSGFFSNTEVLFNKENLNTKKSSFNWGEPIYGRFYWAEGINNYYIKNGWSKPYDTYRYVIRYYANGRLFKEHISQTNGKRTSLPVCLYRDKNDTYDWNEMNILSQNISAFKSGKNTINMEICPYERASNRRSEPVATASFTLNMPASVVASSNFKFKKIETAWKKWDEWKINGSSRLGYLKSLWGKTNEWEFKIGNIKGKIEMTWGKDDQWTLTAGNTKVLIEKASNISISRDENRLWDISIGSHIYRLEPAWPSRDDYWKEWKLSKGKGSLKIESAWNKKDEWDITDNMTSEKPEIKMAAVFMVVYLNYIKN